MSTITDEHGETQPLMPGITPEMWAENNKPQYTTEWGDPMPTECLAEDGSVLPPEEHQGFSEFDDECRDCGYMAGDVQSCLSCQ